MLAAFAIPVHLPGVSKIGAECLCCMQRHARRRSASAGRERLSSSSSGQKIDECQHSSSTKGFAMQGSLSSSGSAEDVDKLKQASQDLEQRLRVGTHLFADPASGSNGHQDRLLKAASCVVSVLSMHLTVLQ